MQAKDLAQLNLRLPRDLRDWLKAEALSNKRTATAEVVLILEKYRQAKESRDVFR